MTVTRTKVLIAQELDELIVRSPPYALSSPSFGSPTLHDYVKGLIVSTNIIEVIDKHIPDAFRADWGQVIDRKDGSTLSRESDIIIYEGKPLKAVRNKSMRFVFVDKARVRVVIQVRSGIVSVAREDKKYCEELKKFVPEVWFIAQCCWAKTKKRIDVVRDQLKTAGYKQFFYFCKGDVDSGQREIIYDPFFKFIRLVERLK